MSVQWGYLCDPLGRPVCVSSQVHHGCEVIGDNCQNHFMGGGDSPAAAEGRTKQIAELEARGEICRSNTGG